MSFYEVINDPNFTVIAVPSESEVQSSLDQHKSALLPYTTAQRDILAANKFFKVKQLIINSTTSKIQQLASISYPGTGTWTDLIA